MATFSPNVSAITLFVADPKRSRAFYEGLFERPPIHEDPESVAFRFENVILNLLVARAGRELIEPAPVAEEATAARFQLTIRVDDADAACAALATHGVELLNGPIDRPWGVRTAAFADPDGHMWEIAQALPPAGP